MDSYRRGRTKGKSGEGKSLNKWEGKGMGGDELARN